MHDKKVSIIGLGLIGGSLAKAMHERLGITDITVIDQDLNSIDIACKDGIISRGFAELNQYVWNSDFIFICTPVKHTFEYIDNISTKISPDCIVTDVCSTKTEIIEYINTIPNPPCFIGGHPMAGTEKTGYINSFSHLFENAYYILSPSKNTSSKAMDCMTELVKGIGAIPFILDAENHDRITACISHVPHIIASALVNMVKESDYPDGKMHMLAAGGFKDITRIASSSPEMWENIILSNYAQIEGILDDYVEILNKFKRSIINKDSESIYNFFKTAKEHRDSFASRKKSLISQSYELIVDVVDKTGIIGEIATILGNNEINIKNINVSNSREFEQGCLKITLPDFESIDIAFNLLTNHGYKVYKQCD